MIHELKTWPAEFEAVLNGTKHHEIRRADRPFAAGDILHLREYAPGPATYTGRALYVAVTYISAAGTWGLPPDLCVMSLGLRRV